MLRQPAKRNTNRAQTAQGASIPAPTGGWNAQDPLPKMPARDAVILDNWIPRTGYVEVRKGSREWATGAVGPIKSLVVWRGGGPGQDEAFAPDPVMEGASVYLDFTLDIYGLGDPSGLYDVTDEGAGFVSPVWAVSDREIQSTNFSNDAGNWLWCCNGSDTPFAYNGTDWAALAITGSAGAITLAPEDLNDVMVHKRRLFTTEKDTLHVWFGDVNAIQGPFQLLDLGPIMNKGGVLAAQGTWSLDGGTGQDDLAVFITTEGQAAIYQGTDPSDANNWALVGVFETGRPMGRRCLLKLGGDLVVLTPSGALPLSQALNLDRAQDNLVAITGKIQNAFQKATHSYGANFGWDAIVYEQDALAIYNIPTVDLTTSHQYVQNLQTGAWCRFLGLDGFCWNTWNDRIFFGADGSVVQWDIGVTDRGVDLVADLRTADNYFGSPGIKKQFTMIRPVLNATANVFPALEVLTDFAERQPVAVPTTIVARDDELSIRANWTNATGIGYSAAARMQLRLESDPDLVSELVTGDGYSVTSGDGFEIAVDSGEPLDAELQAISFDLIYQRGGLL